MESRFPTMLVSWLRRKIYRGMYGNAGEMEPLTPDLGKNLTTILTTWRVWRLNDLKTTGIFLISLLGAEIRIYPDDSMYVTTYRGDYKRTMLVSQRV
ncbi:hypothetical protein AVEN_81005-1 [Araneus ventricosus]|uniref:Uncharacterized protein n=1 Tax=Araneus ventricosus TaxID=182803 RepID=A0A4Y2Q3M6_ARAVE|nr:hypothetical protein AVEN_81005-1 [Araneus ventricosus]